LKDVESRRKTRIPEKRKILITVCDLDFSDQRQKSKITKPTTLADCWDESQRLRVPRKFINCECGRLFAEDLTNHGKPRRNNDAQLFLEKGF
jgi:hypothetical protein